MIQFKEQEVYGFHHALAGMRNPMESWDKIDSEWVIIQPIEEYGKKFIVGENDYKLAMNLSKSGSDHGKYLRMIQVWVDITAPEYWWKEFDTYKVGTTANSTSMMHKLGSRLLVFGDFAFDNIDDEEVDTLNLVNGLIQKWWDSGKKKSSPEWRKLIQHIPQSFLYTRTINFNYQVLKNMYHARRNHRLEEWRTFAKWVETLPYHELITLKEKE